MKSYQFGVDYYPEHWPRERWATDAQMMAEMGIQIVRMAEFSWQMFEPREGEFHFELLDEAIQRLAEHGIDVILGTPTAAPPAWIIEQHPDILPMDDQGHRKAFGARHHDCQSNEAYRTHIRRYVTAFAAHFAANPHVVGWQVDNELGNSHDHLCYCPSCESRFQAWLEKKYGTIDVLNAAWGTAFWSQGYDRFQQILSPKATASGGHNPSHLLDWKRFASDLICEFHQFQADLLRAAAPDKFITHNLMGFCTKLNYYDLAEQLDFASQDQYPGGHFLPHPAEFRADFNGAELDFIRSLKQQSFWIMEQQSGITGWEILGRTPQPGQIPLWALQSVAHGADTIVFFRWRSCAFGTEQYWHGILPHNGKPARYYQEIKALMQHYTPLLQEISGSMPQAEVAILRSYDQEWAFQEQPHHPDHNYLQHLMTYYKALFRLNIPVDFVGEHQDYTPYKVLIAPLQYLLSPEHAAKFRSYVQGGGRLVLTWRSGIKDVHNICYTEGPIPAQVNDLCGVELTEYDCLRATDGLVSYQGTNYPCRHWCDLLTLTGATALAPDAHEFYAGTPAITVNACGSGATYYVGTTMSPSLALRFLGDLCAEAGVQPLMATPEGVEAAHRIAHGRRYLFLLNHTREAQSVSVANGYRTWDGTEWNGVLSAMEVRVFVEEKD